MDKAQMIWRNVVAVIFTVIAFLLVGVLSCQVMFHEDAAHVQKGPK
jgi:hypothetical protein